MTCLFSSISPYQIRPSPIDFNDLILSFKTRNDGNGLLRFIQVFG